MPLDDLDRLLAMELGSQPEQRKLSEQVSSLEALVLSRVQQDHPLAEKPVKAAATEPVVAPMPSIEPLEPLYQFVDALIPIIKNLQVLLIEGAASIEQTELLRLRTEMAEALLALPEVKSLNKAGVFAAMVTCINAAGSLNVEARSLARERLRRLMDSIATIQNHADRAREQALNNLFS